MTTGRSRKDAAIAAGTMVVMFAVYNANGREIASYDSQPTKLAARELLLRGTTSLNDVVGLTPQLLERSGFQLARDSRYRSAYSPVPAIVAAGISYPFWKTGIIDIRAPRAPGLMAKLSSSLLASLTVGLACLIALVPVAVVVSTACTGRVASSIAVLLLVCSVAVAALGAICYPHGRWNSDPVDVDRDHERLWDWRDNQIVRTWQTGPSPQNFPLFTRDAVRTPLP